MTRLEAVNLAIQELDSFALQHKATYRSDIKFEEEVPGVLEAVQKIRSCSGIMYSLSMDINFT